MSPGGAPAAMTEMPWVKWLDLDVTANPDDTVTATLARPKAEHLNHNNTINAVVAYGVAEIAGAGAAVLGLLDHLDTIYTIYTVVESATIAYTAPARAGLVAVGRVEPAAARSAHEQAAIGQDARIRVEVTIADLTGRTTGNCALTIAVRPSRRSQSPRDDRGEEPAAS